VLCAGLPYKPAGAAKRPSGLNEALEQAAQLVLQHPEGDFEPSPAPRVLGSITDDNLVVAWSAVTRAAAQQEGKPPSGLAQKRALAWIVADARGAKQTMSFQVATAVGVRLSTHADRVRRILDEATATAEAGRKRVHSAAATNSALRASLRADLAAIDEAEQQPYSFHGKEIYTGFHELPELLMSADTSDSAPATVPTSSTTTTTTTSQPPQTRAAAPDPIHTETWDEMLDRQDRERSAYSGTDKTHYELASDMYQALCDDRHIISELQHAFEDALSTLQRLRQRVQTSCYTSYQLPIDALFEEHETITYEQWSEVRDEGERRFTSIHSLGVDDELYEGVSREKVREVQQSIDRWWNRPCDFLKLFEEPPRYWVCGSCEARIDAICASVAAEAAAE
jgi:hypothetical protein